MEIILNDYHKKVNNEKRAKVEYWQEHPQSRKEYTQTSIPWQLFVIPDADDVSGWREGACFIEILFHSWICVTCF